VTEGDDVREASGPYKGLAPFEDSDLDALLFFGRDAEQEVITANLLASRLTVLYGPSGCGKSSVLRAGVAHRLRRLAEANVEEGRLPEHAVVVFDRWSDDPAEGIAAAVADAVSPLAGPLAGENGAVSLPDRIGAWVEHLGGELYLVLDQAEEYFLYRPRDGHDEFARALPELVGRPDLPVNVVVSLREDALGRLDVFRPGIPALFGNTLRLSLLDETAARDAVVGPLARYAGLAGANGPVAIEPELVEAVLADTRAGEIELGGGTAGAPAPGSGEGVETAFLQLVLLRLWETERERRSGTLRLQTFRDLGGAERIVQEHLGAALAAFTPEQRDAAAEAFNHLVTPSGTKVAHGLSDLATYGDVSSGFLAPVLSALAEQRILRPLPPADGSTDPRYEIFHDVLAGPIRSWRSEHETEGRLAGERREARRRHRRLLGVTIASLVGLAIAVGLAIFALTQRSEAKEQAQVARSRELAASALAQVAQDSDLALLLGLEAAEVAATPEAETALRQGLLASRARVVANDLGGDPVGVAFLSELDAMAILTAEGDLVLAEPDSGETVARRELGLRPRAHAFLPGRDAAVVAAGDSASLVGLETGATSATYPHGAAVHAVAAAADLVATAGDDEVIRVWDLETGQPPDRARARSATLAYPAAVGALALSSDGELLAAGGADGSLRVWRLRTGELLLESADHRGHVTAIDFHPEGSLLGTASTDGGVRVFDLAAGARVLLLGHESGVTDVAFSQDGERLASGSRDRRVKVWDVGTGRLNALLTGHSGDVAGVAFSPDGETVASVSSDGTARLWDPHEPSVAILIEGGAPLNDGAISPDGRLVYLAGGDGTATAVSLETGAAVLELDHGAPLVDVAVSGDGSLVLTAGADGTLQLWRDGHITATVDYGGPIAGADLSAGGSRIVAAGADDRAAVWDVASGELLGELHGHRNRLTSASFSADGSLIVTTSEDDTARVWDTATREQLAELSGHGNDVLGASFSADGALVVTASADRDVRVWDVASARTVRVLHGHALPVNDARFSPDGRWVVTAAGGAAGIWDVDAGGPPVTYVRGHTGRLTSASFSPGGQLVVTTSVDGTAGTYSCLICAPLPALVEAARAELARTGRELTAEERERYLDE
jgi:WD40 repeat protein